MRVLFSTIFGSRLYGTDVPDSDFDYKHIILPDLDKLLLGWEPVNVFRNNVEFVPVHVLARDFLRGQTYAVELAFAVTDVGTPDHRACDSRIQTFCAELRSKFLTRNIGAMVNFANSQATKYSFKGERLNAAKELYAALAGFPLRSKVKDHEVIPEIVSDLHETYPDCVSFTEYDSDGQGKMQPCIWLLGRTMPLSATVEHTVKQVDAIIRKYGKRANDAANENETDWKAMMHAVRIAYEATELMRTGELTFPHDPEYVREELLPIREGKLAKEAVSQLINAKIQALYEAQQVSSLPEFNENMPIELEAWLIPWLRRFYFNEER